jgi:hypothetical protein
MLMFAGTTFGVVRRALSKRTARTAFPTLGRKLSLSHVEAETPGAAGTLKGTYLGHRVRIESETRARIVVAFDRTIALEIRNYDHWKRTPQGYDTVAFEDQKLNQWLKNRFAGASLRALIAKDPDLRLLLSHVRNDPKLREFAMTPERLEFVFDYGVRGLFPVAAAEQALLMAIKLAERVEHLAAVEHPADGVAG